MTESHEYVGPELRNCGDDPIAVSAWQMFRYLIFLLCFCLLGVSSPVQAQFLPQASADKPAVVPEDLSPEMVDGMLARLTDSEIRELLRAELVRRAEDQMVIAEQPATLDLVETRLRKMSETIQGRVSRWVKALANIDNRFAEVGNRMREGDQGVPGMILAAVAVVAAGFGAAAMTNRVAAGWRLWLITPKRDGYWDKVVRSVALGLVEALAILAFVLATNLIVPLLSGYLGRLEKMHWIYQAGITQSWIAIIIARRAFAPDAPQIRIAPLNDDAAQSLFHLLRRSAQIILGDGFLQG